MYDPGHIAITNPYRQYQMGFLIRVKDGSRVKNGEGSEQWTTPWLDSEEDCYKWAKERAAEWNGHILSVGGASRERQP